MRQPPPLGGVERHLGLKAISLSAPPPLGAPNAQSFGRQRKQPFNLVPLETTTTVPRFSFFENAILQETEPPPNEVFQALTCGPVLALS